VSPVALLDRLAAAGVTLAVENDTVTATGPGAVLTPDVVAELRQHKLELLAALRGDARQRCGDLAAEINAHLDCCRTCRREHFTTDAVTPCCSAGADLKRRYREARRRALEAA